MSMVRRSLTEDDVDRCNQTWTFYLLLLLFLVTWLLPVALLTRAPGDGSVSLGGAPGYIASCWCPAEFTGYMGNYVHAHCTSAFNKVIRNAVYGQNNDTLEESVLFEHSKNEDDIPRTVLFEPTVGNMKNKKQDTTKNVETGSQEKHFIFVRTPLILFVLAICLKLPQFAWALFSSSAGFGFSHLLESARSSQVLDMGSRSQFKQELKKAVEQTIKSSSFFNSILYLLLKVLTLLVTIVGLFIVGYKLLPRAESIQRDMDQRESVVALVTDVAANYSGVRLFCDTNIMVRSSIQMFTIQCMFTPGTSLSAESSNENELALLWIYQAICIIIVVLFAVLSAINIVSLLIWVIRLVPGPFRKKVFRNTSFPMDTYLLLHMARLNAGPLVTSDLEQCLNEEIRRVVQTEDELNILPN